MVHLYRELAAGGPIPQAVARLGERYPGLRLLALASIFDLAPDDLLAALPHGNPFTQMNPHPHRRIHGLILCHLSAACLK